MVLSMRSASHFLREMHFTRTPLNQHTWQVLTLICRVITTEGAHSCRWVFLGLGMWGQWLGEGRQELENEQSTGYLEEKEILHKKGTCDLSREIFTTWPLKKHRTWIPCEGISKGRGTVLIQGSKLWTDYPEVLKGITTTAVCDHNMLVTPLQVRHTNSARSHGYKMRKGVLLPLKRKELLTSEVLKWTPRLLCSVKKSVRKGQHMFPLTCSSEVVRFRDRTQTSGCHSSGKEKEEYLFNGWRGFRFAGWTFWRSVSQQRRYT